jgi:hypothetical protein
VAARSKTWAFGWALAGIVGLNPTGGMDVCLLWVQVEVSATDWSLVQRSPTDCGVPECDLETSKRRRRRPDLGCCATGKKWIWEGILDCTRVNVSQAAQNVTKRQHPMIKLRDQQRVGNFLSTYRFLNEDSSLRTCHLVSYICVRNCVIFHTKPFITCYKYLNFLS